MIFDLIPIVIILIGLGIVIFIVLGKFSQMANVDVDQIPEEKQAELKNKILESQFEKKLGKFGQKISKVASPVTGFFTSKLGGVKDSLLKKKEDLEKRREEIVEQGRSQEEILHQLLDEGANLMEENKYFDAEKKFIKALEIDKTVDIIYENLAEIYVHQKKYDYAIETLKYLIALENKKIKKAEQENDKDAVKLLQRELAQINYDLAGAYKLTEDYKEAKRSAEQALMIDFKNPRYLDFLCEISIILGDKLGAQTCVSRLREANADNNKIEYWEEKIEELK